ncbi:MAG: tetratricopeptide repeat protein, partial [Planctomycetes bacterium]|nr:tetratricopeptide repeat protein [Planctomycetota bacterium]
RPVVRDARYHLDRALAYELDGEHEKALNAYSAALGEDPLALTAWTRQLWMLVMLEETVEAVVWADRALQSFPNDPDILALKSLAQYRNGLVEPARALNDTALAATRDSAPVWLARGEIHLGSDVKSALACFKRAEAAPGEKGLTQLRAGDILFRRRRFVEAVEYYRGATQAYPDSSWAWYGFGRAERAVGREDVALVALDRAISLSPRTVRYRQARQEKANWWRRLRTWLGRR